MRKYQKAGFNEQEAEEFFLQKAEKEKENPTIYRPPTTEEKRDLLINITKLFDLIDKAYNNNNNNLINVDSTFNVEDSKKYEQTDFGKSLKSLLKSITSSCDKYIDKLFGNLKGTISDNMLHSSAYGCNGAYIYGNGVSEIKKLYKYLKEKDKEFKNINISYLPDFKTELKQNLLSYLSQISNDNEKKDFITQIDIPEGDDTTRPINILVPRPSWVIEAAQYNNEQKNLFQDIDRDELNKYGNKWTSGGNSKITKISKKEILGKERCIYKISGDKKQYLKHKGGLITITEYKKIMAAKNKK